MKCPYCEHIFPLTWRRYFSSPLGVHRCPKCEQKSRLKHTVAYYAAMIITAVVLVSGVLIPVVYLKYPVLPFYEGKHNWLVVYLVGIILVILVILDKYFDNRFRMLVKLEEQKK